MSLQASLASRCIYVVRKTPSTNEPHSLCLFSQWCILKRLQSIRFGYKTGSGCQGCTETRTQSSAGMLFGILGEKYKVHGNKNVIAEWNLRQSGWVDGWKVTHMGSYLICFESLYIESKCPQGGPADENHRPPINYQAIWIH